MNVRPQEAREATYIVTHKRPNNQVTLRSVPDATLVVQLDQYSSYRQAWPDQPILTLPEHVTTMGETRQHMAKGVSPQHDGKIILLDDDLSFYHRKDPNHYKLTNAEDTDVADMLNAVWSALDTYAHASVSAREGQNNVSPEDSKPVGCCRYMRLVAYNTFLWPSHIKCDRVNGMSDFDTNLQLLRSGLPSIVFTRWAQSHPATQSEGGISEQRTLEKHAKEVDFMVEAHAPFVTGVDKNDKGPFGKRREVRVQWKKAYDDAISGLF